MRRPHAEQRLYRLKPLIAVIRAWYILVPITCPENETKYQGKSHAQAHEHVSKYVTMNLQDLHRDSHTAPIALGASMWTYLAVHRAPQQLPWSAWTPCLWKHWSQLWSNSTPLTKILLHRLQEKALALQTPPTSWSSKSNGGTLDLDPWKPTNKHAIACLQLCIWSYIIFGCRQPTQSMNHALFYGQWTTDQGHQSLHSWTVSLKDSQAFWTWWSSTDVNLHGLWSWAAFATSGRSCGVMSPTQLPEWWIGTIFGFAFPKDSHSLTPPKVINADKKLRWTPVNAAKIPQHCGLQMQNRLRETLLLDTLGRHSYCYLTLLGGATSWHFCRTLLLDTLVGHSHLTLLWDALTWHAFLTLWLWHSLSWHSGGTLLLDTLSWHSCKTLVLRDSYSALLQDTLTLGRHYYLTCFLRP